MTATREVRSPKRSSDTPSNAVADAECATNTVGSSRTPKISSQLASVLTSACVVKHSGGAFGSQVDSPEPSTSGASTIT